MTEQGLVDLLDQAGQLISKLAHDLRNPLHLVAGYADLLAAESSGPLTANQKRFVQLIRTSAKSVEQEIDRSQERLNSLIKATVKP
ncbi:MAG TPA: histidine kinase dimerization/phospho-acceptor domain-containing protein [Bryobacteraceae bacterium]